MDAVLSPDAALAADIERLKAAHPKTRELYREVCALLFFRYGITPTANRLYQLVRRGSMGTPTAVLGEFWTELREKSRVRIDHPDLPADLGAAAGELVATLWTRATASAEAALDALRDEVEAQRVGAQQAVVAARDELGRTETALEQRTPKATRSDRRWRQNWRGSRRRWPRATANWWRQGKGFRAIWRSSGKRLSARRSGSGRPKSAPCSRSTASAIPRRNCRRSWTKPPVARTGRRPTIVVQLKAYRCSWAIPVTRPACCRDGWMRLRRKIAGCRTKLRRCGKRRRVHAKPGLRQRRPTSARLRGRPVLRAPRRPSRLQHDA